MVESGAEARGRAERGDKFGLVWVACWVSLVKVVEEATVRLVSGVIGAPIRPYRAI